MEESQQMMIKEGIIEYMKTKAGVERTVDEIKLYVEQHKVRIDKGSSALRNALFSLKKENPALINVRRGVYIWKEENVPRDPADDAWCCRAWTRLRSRWSRIFTGR